MVATIGAHPQRRDIANTPGEPIDFSVSVDQATGEPVPSLSGWTATAVVVPERAGAEAIALPVSLLADPARARVTVPGETTAAWPQLWGCLAGQWSLTVTDPTDVPHVLQTGWVQLYPVPG